MLIKFNYSEALRQWAGYNPQDDHELQVVADTPLQREYLDYGGVLPDGIRRSLNVGTVNAYDNFHLPSVPVFHPYNPTEEANERINFGTPYFSVVVRFPQGATQNLPACIIQLLMKHNIPPRNCTTSFCTQNLPWKNTPILFRPHPWLHPDAPTRGNYNVTTNILVAAFDINQQVSSLIPINGISTHPSTGNMIVYSDQQMQIQGVDNSQTHCFYTLCIEPASRRAAFTLHWLLNDAEQEKISTIIPHTDTLRQFIFAVNSLDNSTLTQEKNPGEISPTQALSLLTSGGQYSYSTRPLQYRINPQTAQSVHDDRTHELSELHQAAEQGEWLKVFTLLSQGGNSNLPDNNGYTALHWAAQGGHVNLVKLLVAEGALLNAKNQSNLTPLELARARNHVAVVLFLEQAEQHNKLDGDQLSLLHRAAQTGDHALVKKLLAEGAEVDIIGVGQHTPLHLAAYHGHFDIVKTLLGYGAHRHLAAGNGNTAVSYAQHGGHRQVVDLIKNYNPNELDQDRFSPLIRAAQEGNWLLIYRLLEIPGINVNLKGTGNHTALHLAAYGGHEEVVDLLLAAGADPTILADTGLDARNYAASAKHDKIVEKLDRMTTNSVTSIAKPIVHYFQLASQHREKVLENSRKFKGLFSNK